MPSKIAAVTAVVAPVVAKIVVAAMSGYTVAERVASFLARFF